MRKTLKTPACTRHHLRLNQRRCLHRWIHLLHLLVLKNLFEQKSHLSSSHLYPDTQRATDESHKFDETVFKETRLEKERVAGCEHSISFFKAGDPLGDGSIEGRDGFDAVC
jgi:hypothetical protein